MGILAYRGRVNVAEWDRRRQMGSIIKNGAEPQGGRLDCLKKGRYVTGFHPEMPKYRKLYKAGPLGLNY